MYKLIIADDEDVIRNGLVKLLDWEALGFEVAQVFSDGDEIIEYLEYFTPDVILTDVKMVNASGIDVARYVMENKIGCKVLLLSGFHEFELAVNAIKFGVSDYLLKPVSPEELQCTFEKLKRELDEEKAHSLENNQEKEMLEEMRSILEKQFLEELILGAVNSHDFIDSRFRILYPQIDSHSAGCFLFDIRFKNFEDFMQNNWEYSYDQLEENLNNFMKVYESCFFFRIVYMSNGAMRILGIQNREETSLNRNEQVLAEYDRTEERIADQTLMSLAKMGMEQLCTELESMFSVELERKLQGVFDSVYTLDTWKASDILLSEEESFFHQVHYEEQIQLMVSNVLIGNPLKSCNICHDILEKMKDYTVSRRNREMQGIFLKLCEAMTGVNEALSQMLITYIRESDIEEVSDEASMRDYCDRFFDYMKILDTRESSSTNQLVSSAKKYIWDNICRDVSREEVARRLYICPSYLSKLFVKETGETYLTYVNKAKIEKAIDFLKNPEIRSYQVGEMLGYATPKYFVRLFKAQTGMTPSEYRRKVLSIGGGVSED